MHVPPNAFNPIQVYSLRLFDICEQNSICREGHRALVRLINEMISDQSLGKKKNIRFILRYKKKKYSHK